MKLDFGKHDAILLALTDASPVSVRRDGDGVPTSFRVLKAGHVALTLDGQPVSGELALSDLQSILAWHKSKGEDIPVDCDHLLQKLADKRGVSESELVKASPLLGEKACAGFVALQADGNELWANVTKWTPRARELLSGTGDQVYGYFSPVLRGLKKPPLRITSITLTNNPALNDQDMLAATAEAAAGPDLPIATMSNARAMTATGKPSTGDQRVAPTRSRSMKDALKKLAGLLGLDAAALTAEGAALDGLIEKCLAEIERERAARAAFFASVKDSLALTDSSAPLDAIAGKILSAIEKGKTDAVALTEIQTRVVALEGKERDRFVDGLKAEGKLTDAMLPWAKKQDLAALRDFAATAPVVVPQTRLVAAGAAATGDDALKLSETDRAVTKLCGNKPEDVARANGLTV